MASSSSSAASESRKLSLDDDDGAGEPPNEIFFRASAPLVGVVGLLVTEVARRLNMVLFWLLLEAAEVARWSGELERLDRALAEAGIPSSGPKRSAAGDLLSATMRSSSCSSSWLTDERRDESAERPFEALLAVALKGLKLDLTAATAPSGRSSELSDLTTCAAGRSWVRCPSGSQRNGLATPTGWLMCGNSGSSSEVGSCSGSSLACRRSSALIG